jgi:predicted phosphodiesterase
MKLLITGDIHVDHNPDHEYRWGFFKTLTKHLDRDDVDGLIIAGDTPDRKDRHPAAFVDRLVRETAALAEVTPARKRRKPVIFVKGNHCYIDPECPFFGFLRHIENVEYFTHPGVLDLGKHKILILPEGSGWDMSNGDRDWRRKTPLGGIDGKRWDLIVTHETFNGAMASTSLELKGISLRSASKELTNGCPVVSGDIHVPQQLGNVLYAGSPHHVRFGDTYEPRMLLWNFEKDKAATIPLGGLRRITANYSFESDGETIVTDAKIREGDHVKVRFHGGHEAQLHWAEIATDIRGIVKGAGAVHFAEEFILTETQGEEPNAEEPDAIDDGVYFAQFCAANDYDPAVALEISKQWL